MTADERIKDLGYELIEHDDGIGMFKYENLDNDRCVYLVINPNRPGKYPILYIDTISTKQKSLALPTSISLAEYRAFLDKADEIRNSINDSRNLQRL